ncbi:MAG: hypothetical protein AAF416_15855 [Pseudomonadota bacterium]
MRYFCVPALILLVSCGDDALTVRNESVRVRSQSEAATTHLAVLSRKIYSEDVVSALLPRFPLDGETAFQRSVPLTGDFRALQSNAVSGNVTIEVRPGSVEAPSTVENVADAPDAGPIDSTKPTLAATDNRTAYSSATGLFHDVASLNNYIRNYPAITGHTPYIVRLQLSVIPKRRNLPYDLFSDLSFFADLGERNQSRLRRAEREDEVALAREVRLVPAIPLFATEAVERGRDQQTLATLRAFAASAAGQAGIVSLGGGLSSEQEQLIQALTNELNGLFTIGRVTENVVRVRFGAVQNSSSSYELIPRTHNITLLLLIPDGATSVNIKAKQSMIDVETFEALPPGINSDSYYTRIDGIFARFQLKPKPAKRDPTWTVLCAFRPNLKKLTAVGKGEADEKARRQMMVSFVQKRMRPDVAFGDFETFKLRIEHCLERNDAKDPSIRRLDYLDIAEFSRILWTDLATIQADLPDSFARFEVPPAPAGEAGEPANSQAIWQTTPAPPKEKPVKKTPPKASK